MHDHLKFKRREDLEVESIEIICLELQLSNKSILLSLVYRPPDNDSLSVNTWLHHMENVLSQAYSENKPIVLTGDFNIDLLKDSGSTLKEDWASICENIELTQVIEEPTRVTETSSTLIDHMYVSDLQVIASKVVKCGLSDHFPILSVLNIANFKAQHGNRHQTINYRKLDNVDLESLKLDLESAPWDDIDFTTDTTDTCLDMFNCIFIQALNKHAPIITKRVKRQTQPKWMTQDILHAIQKRDMAKQHFQENEYKQWRNRVTELIRDAKAKHYTESIEDNKDNPRLLSTIFKELGNQTTKGCPTSVDYKGKTYKQESDMAQAFNEHFTNIASNYLRNEKTNPAQQDHSLLKQFVTSKLPPGNYFNIPPVTEIWVKKYLLSMDKNKATGLDNIPAKALKMCASSISKWITKICNHSIKSNVFPNQWKIARVTPLHKKNSVHEPANYRPISILPVLSKILEKHVSNALYEFVTSNDLLSPRQSGFRKKHSCETALNLMTDEWYNSLNDGEYTGILFVDLCKAFDLVDHDILLKKLEIYNFSHSALMWFKSYLSNRSQCVKINKAQSSSLPVKQGVPQGSILASPIFLLSINDLPLYISSNGTINIFADDSTTTVKSKCLATVKENLQKEGKNMERWCTDNNVVISTDKTKGMLLATAQKLRNTPDQNLNIIIQKKTIETVTNEKVLGIQIDNTLSWKAQIKKVRKTILYKLSVLRRIRKYLPTTTRALFYQYYIKPHIEYCCSIWGHCSQKDSNTITKLQKQAARLVLDVDRYTPSEQMFTQLNWPTFEQIVHEKQATLVFKSINNLAPEYMTNMFQKKRGDGLRSSAHNKFFIPRAHHKSLRYCGAKIWNSLPDNARCANNLKQFKRAYRESRTQQNH